MGSVTRVAPQSTHNLRQWLMSYKFLRRMICLLIILISISQVHLQAEHSCRRKQGNWPQGSFRLCQKTDPLCIECPLKFTECQAREGKSNCNVCFKTSLLKSRMDFQLNKCFEMPSGQTSKVVMPVSSFRTCLGGERQTNWRELIQRHELVQRHEIANIFTDNQSRHVLFRASKGLSFSCKMPFTSCIKG